MWKFEIYEDTGGSFRWRLKSSNGQKVATSGESFYAKAAAENVKVNAGSATIED